MIRMGWGGGAEAASCLVMAAQLLWWGWVWGEGEVQGEGSLEDVQGSGWLRNITYLLYRCNSICNKSVNLLQI